MELIQNKVPSTAYSPNGEVGVVSDDDFPVYLSDKHHRLVMIAPGKYQIISGSFTGKIISFADFGECRSTLVPVAVWMPIDLLEFKDFRGVDGAFGSQDRLVRLPEEGVFLFTAGQHIGRKVEIDAVGANMMLAPEA